jgi:hypothetical protein
MNETATALSIIGQNCLNARNIHQRVVEFIETLESHPNFRDLRSSIDRMLTLINESEKQAANEASVVNVNDSVHQNGN